MSEIEQIRTRLEGRVRQLRRELPAGASVAKRVAGVLIGSGAAGIALKMLVRGGAKRGARTAATSAAPIVVRVLPGGALPAAVAIAGIWAAVRIFEARMRASGRQERRGDLRPVSAIDARR